MVGVTPFNQDELDLMKSNVPTVTVKIKGPSNQTTHNIEDETTVWELVHKTVCNGSLQSGFDPAVNDYALFLGTAQLDEDSCVLAHQITDGVSN